MIRGFLRQARVARPSRAHYRLRHFSDDKSAHPDAENAVSGDTRAQTSHEGSANTTDSAQEAAGFTAAASAASAAASASTAASGTTSKPWYLREQPEVKEEPVQIDLGLPEGPMNDIVRQLARDAVYDIKYIPEQDIIIGSGKSSRHIYKAGREVMGMLKHQHDVLPTAEGLFKKNAQRMSYRRMLKKARKQNLEFPDSEWVVIDSQMGFHVHIFTAEKRQQVNLEDLYKFEMDEEEVELSPEDFVWAEKGHKNIIDGDEFLSGQESADPFLRADSITGAHKKASNPFGGQRRSIHTSSAVQSSISMGYDAAVAEEEPRNTVVPVFMYKEWASRGDKETILENLADLQPNPARSRVVLSAFTRFLKLPTTGYSDVPQAVEEMFGLFSPSVASKEEWREVFQALLNAYALNHKCVPCQALVDCLVAQQAAGVAVTKKQVMAVVRVTVDSTQFEQVGVTSLPEWQRVVDAKVQIIKQLIESFGIVTPVTLMKDHDFVLWFARALTQKTRDSFGLTYPAKPDTTHHPLDLRLQLLEQGLSLTHTNRQTLFLLLAAYANSYAWGPFFALLGRCNKSLEMEPDHVETVVSLVLNSRDESAYLLLLENNTHLISKPNGDVLLNQRIAERLVEMMDAVDPEEGRFVRMRRRARAFIDE